MLECQNEVSRIILFRQYLAKHHDAFCSTNRSLFQGKFLDLRVTWNEVLECPKHAKQIIIKKMNFYYLKF